MIAPREYWIGDESRTQFPFEHCSDRTCLIGSLYIVPFEHSFLDPIIISYFIWVFLIVDLIVGVTMAAATSGGREYDLRDRGSRFRDLDDRNEFPTPQHKKKRYQDVDPNTGLIMIPKMYAEFHVVEMQDEKQKTFEKISPFFIEKALTSYIGQQHETKRLRNRKLLVKCKNEKQAQLLMSYNSNNNAILYKYVQSERLRARDAEYCWRNNLLPGREIFVGGGHSRGVKGWRRRQGAENPQKGRW